MWPPADAAVGAAVVVTSAAVVDSSGAVVVDPGGPRSLLPMAAGGAPAWSPDGTRVAWATSSKGIFVSEVASELGELVGEGEQATFLDANTLIVEDQGPEDEGTP